jgi:hypothetical protein
LGYITIPAEKNFHELHNPFKIITFSDEPKFTNKGLKKTEEKYKNSKKQDSLNLNA